MDPVSGLNAKNRQAHGALSLHVDDLLMTGDDVFEKEIMGRFPSWFRRQRGMVVDIWLLICLCGGFPDSTPLLTVRRFCFVIGMPSKLAVPGTRDDDGRQVSQGSVKTMMMTDDG